MHVHRAGFYYLDGIRNWSILHTLEAWRLLFFPTMLLLGLFGWKYANAMQAVYLRRTSDLESLMNAQGYFWLIVVLHVFVIVGGLALTISLAYAY